MLNENVKIIQLALKEEFTNDVERAQKNPLVKILLRRII